eukprot:SM000005S17299  [mRNA]  locus=s5:1367510:1369292:+ [translate_table: standard]
MHGAGAGGGLSEAALQPWALLSQAAAAAAAHLGRRSRGPSSVAAPGGSSPATAVDTCGGTGLALALTAAAAAAAAPLLARQLGGGAMPAAAAAAAASAWGPPLAALSLSRAVAEAEAAPLVAEPATGMLFPARDDGSELVATGVRSKSVLGLKKIKVYAFGVYADPGSLRGALGAKYTGTAAAPEALARSRYFLDDVVAGDTALTVRLVIFYKGLKIGQVRSAFEESVGSGITRLNGGKPNTALLQSFTSIFKDEVALQRGTTIELARQPGHVLTTKIDGVEVGSVRSTLLCRALFDLYLGQSPFDQSARDAAARGMAVLLTPKS